MALSASTKTIWLLVLGAALVVLLILPLRFSPVVPRSIAALPVPARTQLIQLYEQPARTIQARTDTLRREIIRRYGGVGLTQDSLLKEQARRAAQMLEIVSHLRDPRRATFEEKRQDIGKLLEQLKNEALQTDQHLRETFLK